MSEDVVEKKPTDAEVYRRRCERLWDEAENWGGSKIGRAMEIAQEDEGDSVVNWNDPDEVADFRKAVILKMLGAQWKASGARGAEPVYLKELQQTTSDAFTRERKLEGGRLGEKHGKENGRIKRRRRRGG